MAREEAPQRADRETVPIVGQPGADLGQRQVVVFRDQRVDPPGLRLDPVR